MKKKLASLAFSFCLLGAAMPAGANVIALGSDLLYDDQQNITWYDHLFPQPPVSPSITNPYDKLMHGYNESVAVVYSLDYQGLTDWRLPTLWEFAKTDEAFGDFWDQPEGRNPQRDASEVFYGGDYCLTSWVVSDTYPDPTGYGGYKPYYWARVYQPLYGEVGISNYWNVVAVMDGKAQIDNVGNGAPPVPEPATMLLTGVGLAGTGLSKLRKKKKEQKA